MVPIINLTIAYSVRGWFETIFEAFTSFTNQDQQNRSSFQSSVKLDVN